MATVQSTLKLNDKMSGVMGNIVKAMNSTLTAMRAIKKEDLGKEFADASADIKLAEKSLNDYNKSLQESNDNLNKASGSAGGLISKLLTVAAVGKLVNLSDEYTSSAARLDLINDGLQTNAELQDKIFASAQRSRAAYTDTANAVAKLGLTASKSFTSNDEMIRFVELMNKNFIVAGASSTEQASAMYQLTQAMSSGRLQGDEYRSIIENAPLLAKAIEDYMRNVEGVKGSMKEWASEGLLTADVIKAALFNSADAVDKRFKQMPMTWSQVWTKAVNKLQQAMQPLLKFINKLGQHWEILEPIVIGLTTAVGLYTAALLVNRIAVGWASFMANAHAASLALQTGATFAATAAQYGFNAALYACPLVWILAIIILVTAAIYALVAAIAKATDATLSATGIILGALVTAGAFILNLVIGVLNAIIGLVDWVANVIISIVEFILNACMGGFTNFGDAVANLIGTIISWFLDLGSVVTTIIDAIFGTDWTSGLNSLRDSVLEWGKKEDKSIKLERWDHQINRVTYSDAYNYGYTAGTKLDSMIGNAFGSDSPLSSASGILEDVLGTDASGGKAIKTTTDDDLLSDEDIQLLLDVATRDYKLNYQQVTPQITLTFGDIRETADVDEILDEVATRLEEIYDGNLEVE